MPKKNKESETWKCPKCGEKVPKDFCSSWDHVISKHS